MRLAMALILMMCVPFIACDQGQVPGASDFTRPGKAFVEMLARGEYADAFAQFDTPMKDAMPVDQIKASWESLLAQVGEFQKVTGLRQAKEQGYDVVYVTCAFEKSELNVKVVYSDEKEISGLWFLPK
jgi:hypothetical protein